MRVARYGKEMGILKNRIFWLLLVGVALMLTVELLRPRIMTPAVSPHDRSAIDWQLSLPVVSGAVADLATRTAFDYPQFQGPNRNASVDGAISTDWSARGPEFLWMHNIGAGWSGFAIVNGFAVTMEQRGEDELTTCYRLEDGEMVWWNAHKVRYTGHTVGPRSTPAISGGRVYSIGGEGRLACLNGSDGAVIWELELHSEFGTEPWREREEVSFGRSGSPLVVDGMVIVPAGGAGLSRRSLAAFHAETGKRLWDCGRAQISYSSPALLTVDGKSQIVYVSNEQVFGCDPMTGKELWAFDYPSDNSNDVNVSIPQSVGDSRIFLSKAYGVGASVYEVTSGDSWEAGRVWGRSKVLRSKFNNIILHEGHAYGTSEGILECVNLENGERVWKRGRYEDTQVLRVGNQMLIQTSKGWVAGVLLSTEQENEQTGTLHVFEGTTWNAPAIYGRKLLMRNSQHMACLQLPE
ncbi:MAG: outer membrane protein assembly factor BamB [Rhodothermales bacterium]|jgi:outer membrane protein assembly factor BamB